MNIIEEPSILSLAFPARQRIIVVSDSLAERVLVELRRTPELPEGDEQDDSGVVDRVRGAMRRKVDDAVAHLVQAVISLRKSATDIRIISDTQSQGLSFPPGHPARSVLYIAHPVALGQYYPAATFHRLVVEHKFAEAMDLIMELGAQSINIEQLRGYKKNDLFEIISAIPGVRIGGKSGRETETQSSITVEAELEGTGQARIPDDSSWLKHEPMWMKLAENRMEGRLRKFSLAVRHLDSMCIDKSLETEIKKFGFRVGGNFKEHEEVIWRLSGEFPPLEQLATERLLQKGGGI